MLDFYQCLFEFMVMYHVSANILNIYRRNLCGEKPHVFYTYLYRHKIYTYDNTNNVVISFKKTIIVSSFSQSPFPPHNPHRFPFSQHPSSDFFFMPLPYTSCRQLVEHSSHAHHNSHVFFVTHCMLASITLCKSSWPPSLLFAHSSDPSAPLLTPYSLLHTLSKFNFILLFFLQ